MGKIKITISKVEKRDSNFGITNYKQSKVERNRYRVAGYCLYVEGLTEGGEKVHFFTPQAEFIVSLTFGESYRLHKNTGDFFEEGKQEVIPAISVGQQVIISFRSEEEKFSQRRLKVVRLEKEEEKEVDLF